MTLRGNQIMPSLGRIGLERFLPGEQIVAHRNDRKEDADQDRNGDKLFSMICLPRMITTQPEAYHCTGQKQPREIEE